MKAYSRMGAYSRARLFGNALSRMGTFSRDTYSKGRIIEASRFMSNLQKSMMKHIERIDDVSVS